MVSILWFRHGLRFHDNPALLEALKGGHHFLPIFIFDGESAGTKLVGYNRMKFLLECLSDLDERFKALGSKLYCFNGDPVTVFGNLHQQFVVKKICFEQDCEPIWLARDDAVKAFCSANGIECVERVSHTLWDPKLIIAFNDGSPPLTYEDFLNVSEKVGPPPRPVADPDWSNVNFFQIPLNMYESLKTLKNIPSLKDFNMNPETTIAGILPWRGGETRALQHLRERLMVEADAFKEGFFLPNVARPDLLAAPTSQSPALRFGCLSVRRFFWSLHDLYNEVHEGQLPPNIRITGQLIWREYFYTMSVNNPYYAVMDGNPICMNIPWAKNDERLQAWKDGQTGFPFIDAVMRQLKQEGWIHHVGRNAAAAFLTRGCLWISWEDGLQFFLRHLLDADWSVCAGNWMWVSSSAFEQLLDCSNCVCPVNYGRRLDPSGDYIRRYVPELRHVPIEYLFEPWKAPLELQVKCNSVIGRDYPERIIDHVSSGQANSEAMARIRKELKYVKTPHCAPSNEEEIRQFMWLPEACLHNI